MSLHSTLPRSFAALEKAQRIVDEMPNPTPHEKYLMACSLLAAASDTIKKFIVPCLTPGTYSSTVLTASFLELTFPTTVQRS
jgi:hypothetical protein